MRFIEGLRTRIELESDKSRQRKYQESLHGLQRLYEFTWDLRELFGRRFGRLLDRVVNYAFGQLQNVTIEDVGRNRFLRVIGPIKIPLTPIKE